VYLFDTNIFLEILLGQKKSADCKRILADNINSIFISDFSLHSIGVILFRNRQEKVFNSFVTDVLPKIEIVSLSIKSYKNLSKLNKYNLDFDDSYQYKVAEEQELTILTMDKDFMRVKDKIKVKFL